MIRTTTAMLALLLAVPVLAQEATPTAPAPADITINPAAVVDNSSKQANVLTGFYATQAVIEICAIELDDATRTGMTADRERLESSIGMDSTTGETAYARVKADVEKTTPDCAEGSADRLGVEAVTSIYAGQGSNAAAGATAPVSVPAPAVDTPATPAPAVDAPAAPAQ